jgi:hypothetical protein
MLTCILSVAIFAIVCLIVLALCEYIVAMFLPLPAPIVSLFRLLVGVLILIRLLECLGLIGPHVGLSATHPC